MTHEEKRIYLIRELLAELPDCSGMGIPDHEGEQKRLLRSLMNIRPPRPVSDQFLRIQDEYLREEAARKGITDAAALPASGLDGRLLLWKGDITTLKIDAIVNAANSSLRGCFIPCHSCVDNIIHSVSGIQLRLDCDRIMKEQGYDEPTGRAKITPAYNLPSRYVIHTVGPIVTGRLTDKHCRQLADCYQSCLELAAKKRAEKYCVLLYFYGRISFPQGKGGRNCGTDGCGLPCCRQAHRKGGI